MKVVLRSVILVVMATYGWCSDDEHITCKAYHVGSTEQIGQGLTLDDLASGIDLKNTKIPDYNDVVITFTGAAVETAFRNPKGDTGFVAKVFGHAASTEQPKPDCLSVSVTLTDAEVARVKAIIAKNHPQKAP